MPGYLSETTRLLAQLAADDLHSAEPHTWVHRLLRFAFLLGIGLVAAAVLTASAAEPVRTGDPLYQIELIILKPSTVLGVPEDWSIEARRAHPVPAADAQGESDAEGSDPPGEQAIVDTSAQEQRLAVRTLTPGQFRLTGIESSLGKNAAYEVLRHVGWTQAATPRGLGPSVELADVSSNDQPVRGTVTLERGRYLYLRLNLAYTPEIPPSSLLGQTSEPGTVTFALRQTRRIRPFERHYFDHPAFGVIAMVSPVGTTPR